MGALQLVCLGIIGEYIRLIFLESKQRPTYIAAQYQGYDDAGAGLVEVSSARRRVDAAGAIPERGPHLVANRVQGASS